MTDLPPALITLVKCLWLTMLHAGIPAMLTCMAPHANDLHGPNTSAGHQHAH